MGPAEPVTELLRPSEAWIVRCKYDSEVLITCGDSALPMVDLDGNFDLEGQELRHFALSLHRSELQLQLRVYKTAHGYRLLVENQTLKTGGEIYQLLDRCFGPWGSDTSYFNLCKKQKCFRARLTPKPEATEGARVCEYLGTIGSGGIDENLAPLIHLHDERTGALLESGELG